jgi:hypothetical protein
MIKLQTGFILLFQVLLLNSCSHVEVKDNKTLLQKSFNAEKTFEEFWAIAIENIYPKSLSEKYFTNEQYKMLKLVCTKGDLYEFSNCINTFLDKLNISHTHLYNDLDYDFYFFRSLFTTKTPDVTSHPMVTTF